MNNTAFEHLSLVELYCTVQDETITALIYISSSSNEPVGAQVDLQNQVYSFRSSQQYSPFSLPVVCSSLSIPCYWAPLVGNHPSIIGSERRTPNLRHCGLVSIACYHDGHVPEEKRSAPRALNCRPTQSRYYDQLSISKGETNPQRKPTKRSALLV